ncbi:hypothetical protein [Lentzea sp. NPDC051838]|uniref:hypothetical protein n=1 Tax=Lentzea sp. NPDC051838 TaxID=3154849 RepID=UPI003443FAFE
MAGAVGIVFGLCVLSFTLGAALMYVVMRRREDAATHAPSSGDEPVERTWVEKPAAVEPVDDDYDSRPIHRNPVMGLPQLEPALAAFAHPLPEPVATPKTVGAAGYDRDGDLESSLGDDEAPESTVAAGTDSSEVVEEPVAEPEPVAEVKSVEEPEPVAEAEVVEEPVAELEPEPRPEPEPKPEVVVETALPPPAAPQPVENTTWVEREDFRQRYLRTFEEVRRKAGSN